MGTSSDDKYAHLRERYTEQRVMKIFGISRSTLKRWISEGLIQAVRISSRRLEFEKDEVERRYRVCRGEDPAGGSKIIDHS